MSQKSIVTTNIDSNPSVLDVARLMVKNKVGSIIVIKDKGNPVGIITERDILKKVSIQNKEAGQVQAKDIMSSPLFTVKAIDSIDTAAEAMVKNGVKRLVVIEQDGSVQGVLSMSDIVKELAKILTDEYRRYHTLRNILDLQS
jgi:CBS domain-containing protein